MKSFLKEAERISALPIESRVNRLGGYGPCGEVIYEGHPSGCPSVLVDGQKNATATFMSNGSVDFMVKLPNGMEVKVLDGHFDISEKREVNAPSSQLWIAVEKKGGHRIASLMTPRNNIHFAPKSVRLVKLGDPRRAMWYTAEFELDKGEALLSRVKLSFVYTDKGPALLRETALKNIGSKPVSGKLWSHFTLHGTQLFVYNKQIWYDQGMALSGTESVVSARVPWSDVLQVKRLSADLFGLKPLQATCDYSIFAGDSAANLFFPDAVLKGALLPGGAGASVSRFAVPAIAANSYAFALKPGRTAALRQSLLYITDEATYTRFRKTSSAPKPLYKSIAPAFKKAAQELVKQTPGAAAIRQAAPARGTDDVFPFFELTLPREKVVANYANSVWTGVKELYENCRAHGAKLADGIELGTRDRAQDMWPKIKEDPGRVRQDLVHALSFMYITVEGNPDKLKGRLTLRQKLHGMFPRQYPSHWFDRTKSVMNDNRPYTDSPVWLIDALCMYVRETGDISLLFESVSTIRLTNPDCPEKSGIVGNRARFTLLEIIMQVYACFERHAKDTPYGICQILYGDWCDPVDMFGTFPVGDAGTRGQGQGVEVRLSAHVFISAVAFLDLLESEKVQGKISAFRLKPDIKRLKVFANRLRQNIIKVAWEDGTGAGFIGTIHELKRNGKRPAYKKGELGYTLGSMKGFDFDGEKRRVLTVQAFCLEMLRIERNYLAPVPERDRKVAALLQTVDQVMYDPKLGLRLYNIPIGNNQIALDYVGRMGVVPSGTAENGEYHHAQAFMHTFRMDVPGQVDKAFQQFKPMMSALRDESIAGPFETPCTSYVSDPDDPHFGRAMYFGLSGSTDWIVEIFNKIAGICFNLHDDRLPAVSVRPNLPKALDHSLIFRRIIHFSTGAGRYRRIPFTLSIQPKGMVPAGICINGVVSEKAEVKSLEKMKELKIEIVR